MKLQFKKGSQGQLDLAVLHWHQHNMGFGNIAIRRVVCTCAVLFFKQNFACIQTTFTHQVAHILGLHTCARLFYSPESY